MYKEVVEACNDAHTVVVTVLTFNEVAHGIYGLVLNDAVCKDTD